MARNKTNSVVSVTTESLVRGGQCGQATKRSTQNSRKGCINMFINQEFLRWEKRGIQLEDRDQMGWEAVEAAIKSIPVNRQHWLTKQVSGMSGVKK